MINKFDGEHSFLSNFYPTRICVTGIVYSNSESAYQAGKTLNLSTRREFKDLTGGQAKRLGSKIELRQDWSKVVKLEVMELVLRSKFMNKDMANLLLATGERKLIEGNVWNDTFWGVCNDEGSNYLGRMLMMIRNDIKLNKEK